MAIEADDYLSYYKFIETPASLVQDIAHEISGEARVHRFATPAAEPYHSAHFSIPELDFSTTIPMMERVLTKNEDRALWRALEQSSKLVAKGRLI